MTYLISKQKLIHLNEVLLIFLVQVMSIKILHLVLNLL